MTKTLLGSQKKLKISFKRKTMFIKAIEIVKTITYSNKEIETSTRRPTHLTEVFKLNYYS